MKSHKPRALGPTLHFEGLSAETPGTETEAGNSHQPNISTRAVSQPDSSPRRGLLQQLSSAADGERNELAEVSLAIRSEVKQPSHYIPVPRP